ncbi:dihydroxyacetone kinase subunit DhaL [Ancylothrix sp. C2]|uniref:dihydroxyacetone kinase subunit DhaL n=1 Tax=Ancylothrix sp. D3o TaxID=2953691 RepID=UPI0021BB5DC6|nr:dihydroxyacetone kinase subunit DhaL [Ancylothrix sp. D3o]MCT7952430.1 dihydroxyacetone kinase subunit DhaL [Ancylothrix sp. D3o]
MTTKQQILQWLQTYATVIEQNKDYLTELDAAIGDADHGINMNRGFQKVLTQLPTLAEKDISNILKAVSMTLISSVGGASGALYGTFFLRASNAVTGLSELTPEDTAKLLETGLSGVRERGKANLGEKTMLDTLQPASQTFTKAISEGNNTLEALKEAVIAAEQGMKNTIPLIAKKGRATYLGERSIGHQDPGATSAYLMLKTLQQVLQ